MGRKHEADEDVQGSALVDGARSRSTAVFRRWNRETNSKRIPAFQTIQYVSASNTTFASLL
jgi:hypothetical protein